MEVGMTLPSMIEGIDRAAIRRWCDAVDAGPFSSIACGERIAYPNQEMWSMLAAAAALTERPRVVATVAVLPLHDPVAAAKRAATIDVISGGRFVLGVGIGGRDEDFAAVGADPARRHVRLDDAVATMQRVWAGEPPYEGIHPVGPHPVQPGGPPLLAGALGPKAIARAARWAAGISGFVLDPTGEDHAVRAAQVRAAWSAAGRVEPPRLVSSFWYGLGSEGADRARAYARRYLAIFGNGVADAMAARVTASSADAVAAGLDRFAAAGFDEVFLVPTSADAGELVEVEAIVRSLR